MSADRDLKRIRLAIEKAIKRSLSPTQMRKLGKLAIKIIQQRTRRGFGVKKSGAPRRRLKPLSREYIRRRRRARLSRFTSAKKSNLTFSGQLLSLMRATVKKPGSVTINFDKRRRDGRKNSEIAEAVSKERPFNNLSKVEIRALVESYDRTLQRTLDKALTGL